MVIHSIMPTSFLMQDNLQPSSEFRPYQRGYIEGHCGDNGFVVSRIISTDPAAYLDPSITVGSTLPTTPSIKS